jgi:hypothetical protein
LARSIPIGVLVLLGAICLVAASAEAGVVAVASAHANVTVPTGWTIERNYTESGLTYDLYLTSPTSVSGQVIGMFAHSVQSGSFGASDLWQSLKSEMESSGFTDFTYVVVPRNITVGGLPACDATLSVNAGMVTVNERLTVAYSSDWHLVYMFIFAVVSTGWSSYSSAIDSMIMSLSVDEKAGGGGSSTLYIAIGLVIVAVAVVVTVVLLMMRKKKPEPVLAPPVEMPPVPPAPPPTT